MAPIGYAKTRQALTDVIQAHPRTRNPEACVYFKARGKPSCIVGHVMASLGIEATQVLDVNDESITVLNDELGLFTDKARDLLARAQARADQFEPWGRLEVVD